MADMRTKICLWTLLAFGISPLASGSDESAEWGFLGGNPQSQQYGAIEQINSQNVGSLGLLWHSDLPVKEGLVGNPLVKDGVVYQSAPRGAAIATDVVTGKTLWTFLPDIDLTNYSQASMWAAHSTRGLGMDDDSVYTTGGCELYAVDRKTGKQRWHARACDPTKDVGIVPAPRVGGSKVFVGSNNAELGTNRGFAAAFDARTGRELWRFFTVPGDPSQPFENKQMELAAKTWGNSYWVDTHGAAAVWEGMVYDPQTNLLIFGTGNPGVWEAQPEKYGELDMLYSDSLIAVNASTGQYAWHFQFVQGDVWDLGDGAAHIMLADLPLQGRTRHVVMQAAKDGYFYLFDAKTGAFISANNYVPVTNYQPIDPKTGKLIVRDEVKYWKHPGKTVVLQPGEWGSHTWELTSYNPKTGLVYIPAFVFPTASGSKNQRESNVDANDHALKSFGRLVAWDPIAQKERWHVDHPVVINGGALSTAGNLVFEGTPEGKFYAYDATNGRLLWSYDTHGIILGAPSTVVVHGKQIILVPSGDGAGGVTTKFTSRISTTPETIAAPSRLLAFALGAKGVLPAGAPKVTLKPVRPPQPAAIAARGEQIFSDHACGSCHGDDLNIGGAGRVPDLRNIRESTLQAMPQILRQGVYSPLGMPRFPDITDKDISALQAFILNSAWAAYDSQAH